MKIARPEIGLEEVKNAYRRLKSYIYYDNTDILLRKQLVEFETNSTKDFNSISQSSPAPYNLGDAVFEFGISETLESKLEKITKNLNEYENAPNFFDISLIKLM